MLSLFTQEEIEDETDSGNGYERRDGYLPCSGTSETYTELSIRSQPGSDVHVLLPRYIVSITTFGEVDASPNFRKSGASVVDR